MVIFSTNRVILVIRWNYQQLGWFKTGVFYLDRILEIRNLFNSALEFVFVSISQYIYKDS